MFASERVKFQQSYQKRNRILTKAVSALEFCPFCMSEEHINARIAKVYWIEDELMKEVVHYGYTPRNKNGDTYDKPSLYQPGSPPVAR
jgi:hypothetical protein